MAAAPILPAAQPIIPSSAYESPGSLGNALINISLEPSQIPRLRLELDALALRCIAAGFHGTGRAIFAAEEDFAAYNYLNTTFRIGSIFMNIDESRWPHFLNTPAIPVADQPIEFGDVVVVTSRINAVLEAQRPPAPSYVRVRTAPDVVERARRNLTESVQIAIGPVGLKAKIIPHLEAIVSGEMGSIPQETREKIVDFLSKGRSHAFPYARRLLVDAVADDKVMQSPILPVEIPVDELRPYDPLAITEPLGFEKVMGTEEAKLGGLDKKERELRSMVTQFHGVFARLAETNPGLFDPEKLRTLQQIAWIAASIGLQTNQLRRGHMVLASRNPAVEEFFFGQVDAKTITVEIPPNIVVGGNDWTNPLDAFVAGPDFTKSVAEATECGMGKNEPFPHDVTDINLELAELEMAINGNLLEGGAPLDLRTQFRERLGVILKHYQEAMKDANGNFIRVQGEIVELEARSLGHMIARYSVNVFTQMAGLQGRVQTLIGEGKTAEALALVKYAEGWLGGLEKRQHEIDEVAGDLRAVREIEARGHYLSLAHNLLQMGALNSLDALNKEMRAKVRERARINIQDHEKHVAAVTTYVLQAARSVGIMPDGARETAAALLMPLDELLSRKGPQEVVDAYKMLRDLHIPLPGQEGVRALPLNPPYQPMGLPLRDEPKQLPPAQQR